jgi:8-oxo-dGTP pyrophosphatase MutT (NUDIX family)
MTLRPDLVGCWIFRVTPERGLEILLLRRAAGRIYPGVWQCVTGGLEGDEKVVDGALRELREETGFTEDDLEALYGLDQVNLFHADHVDALMSEAVFAARVKPTVEPVLSHEHDASRWLPPEEAREAVVWPAYRFAIEQLEWLLSHPQHAPWLLAGRWAPPAAKLPGT